jgi:hypothetical protein
MYVCIILYVNCCYMMMSMLLFIVMFRGCSGSQKVGARKIARCQLNLFTRSQFFRTETVDDCMYLACSVSCINGPDLFVQMLMSVLYFCFSFRFIYCNPGRFSLFSLIRLSVNFIESFYT